MCGQLCVLLCGHTCDSIYTGVSSCVDISTGVATQVTTCEDFLRCVLTCGPPRGPHRISLHGQLEPV